MFDLRPLGAASFRHLAAGYWVNEFGNWIGEIALALLVYDRTQSPLATASLFLALRLLPALLGPLLTVRLEALQARLVLTALYVLESVFFAGIAWLSHHFSLAAVFALGGLDGVLAVAAKALTRGATARGLLERDLLREGNGILSLGAMASTAGSPVIAGVLVAWKGAAAALLVDAATFLVTAAIIVTAPDLELGSDVASSFTRRLDHVIELLHGHTPLRRLLAAIALIMVASAIPIPIEVVFAKHTLHAGASGYGLLLGSWGVGMVVGGAIFAAGNSIALVRLLVAGTLLNAVGYAGLALSPTLAVACVCSAFGGVGNGAAWVAAVTSVQERVPADTQSAIMSMLEGMNQVMPALGFVAGGIITAATSPRVAYAVAAGGIAAVVLGAFSVAARRGAEIPLRPVQMQSDQADETPDGIAEMREAGSGYRKLSILTLTSG